MMIYFTLACAVLFLSGVLLWISPDPDGSWTLSDHMATAWQMLCLMVCAGSFLCVLITFFHMVRGY
jgi:ABC-type polysaccharide/polyol phosphate export permease